MDTKTSKNRPWLRNTCKIAIAIGMTVAAGSYTEPTRAQWVVMDPTQITNSLMEYGETLMRWEKTFTHMQETVSFWQEQLVKIQSLQFSLFQVQQNFPKLPDDFGVAQNCPGGTAFSGDITSALSNFTGQLTGGNVTTQQRDVCVLIQMTKNQKYEATRLYLQQIGAQTSALQQLANLRLIQVLQSPGKLSSYQADTTKFTADMAQARDSWKTNEEQLDAQIEMLERRQAVLSRQAIDGDPNNLIGTLVNMAALKAAFSL